MILYVTNCSKNKRTSACRVEDLYLSDRVKRFIEFCNSKGLPWAILSAKYGLLYPGTVVEPYDVTIKSEKNNKKCFLGLRVHVNGKALPVEESNKYLKELCNKIASQLVERGVSRIVFYAKRPRSVVAYIKILQAALENCREMPRDEDTLDYVARKELIVVITRLE